MFCKYWALVSNRYVNKIYIFSGCDEDFICKEDLIIIDLKNFEFQGVNNNNWLVYTDSTATARNILTLASNDNLYLQYKAGSNFYLRNTDGDLRLTISSNSIFSANLITKL